MTLCARVDAVSQVMNFSEGKLDAAFLAEVGIHTYIHACSPHIHANADRLSLYLYLSVCLCV